MVYITRRDVHGTTGAGDDMAMASPYRCMASRPSAVGDKATGGRPVWPACDDVVPGRARCWRIAEKLLSAFGGSQGLHHQIFIFRHGGVRERSLALHSGDHR